MFRDVRCFERSKSQTKMKKFVFLFLGLVFLGLAYIGILLPGVPAIPFILLASWCFSNSSEKLYQWLLRQKIIGNVLQKYSSGEKISKPLVWLVISQLWVSLIVAQLLFKPNLVFSIVLNLLGILGSIFFYRFMLFGKWRDNSNKKQL